jgi:hypothetical protein
MEYKLKDKIEITEEFLMDLISKSWQDAESIQQQAANIDTSTALGTKVAQLLKNISTNYFVLIGCLENLVDNDIPTETQNPDEVSDDVVMGVEQPIETELPIESEDSITDFEPFEYFVDFDEPSGEPLTDEDLYK